MSSLQINQFEDIGSFASQLRGLSGERDVYHTLCTFISQLPGIRSADILHLNDHTWEGSGFGVIPDFPLPCSLCSARESCEVTHEGLFKPAADNVNHRSQSIIVLPLTSSDSSCSVLCAETDNNFISSDASSVLAAYIEIARLSISRNQTIRKLSIEACTDSLTGLYNRSFLNAYLQERMVPSDLDGHPLSVIMIDLDFFKDVNDTMGHAVGDYVLKYFAGIILGCVRKSDVVVRYGGEEFIVVLPYANIETALIISERIRQTLQAASIPQYDDIVIPPVSCSCGVSAYPVHAYDSDTLIKTADIALYKAKQLGRNRSVVYESVS